MFDEHSETLKSIFEESGQISREQLDEAWEEHVEIGKPFTDVLEDGGFFDRAAMLEIIARNLGVEYVGEIPDRSEEPDIIRRDDGGLLIDGQCPFYDFLASLGIEEECSATAYNTISGLVLDQLDHIPQSGEHVEWNGYRIEVVDMDGARIDKLLVTPLEKTEK